MPFHRFHWVRQGSKQEGTCPDSDGSAEKHDITNFVLHETFLNQEGSIIWSSGHLVIWSSLFD